MSPSISCLICESRCGDGQRERALSVRMWWAERRVLYEV